MAGLLSRILRRPVETRALDYENFRRFFGIAQTPGAGHVSPRLAENLATVTACVGAVASVMASLPAYVYRKAPGGRTELHDHPVARLVRRPNSHQSWPDLLEWLMAQALLHGNALAEIQYDAAGRATALVPIPWPLVSVVVLPSGRIAYDIAPANGPRRRLLEGEVFHLRDRSDDGIVGRSRISRAPEVLGIAISANAAVNKLYSGGLWARGFIEAPSFMTETQRNDAERWVSKIREAIQLGRLPLLEGGFRFNNASISPEDAELLASRRFSVEELCRLFQVPPPIVQDLSHGTFTNSREAGRWFAQFSLAPWARKIEAEFERSVFGPGSADCMLEMDLSALMRADAEARWQSHKIAVDAGILDPDEIREIEGWNPRAQQSPEA
ncbi:phage portal protein [Roseomonas sp. KE0001]|uniref:phage portal protein n=1 Tax=Roseomonas sp. KE0001 TaxID=2479201 RepID=UPI0018E046E0|nr:phage portal protein [Roseomonas sp. KE0001]MBI0432808.1 phage portal protein [Roseomonas sp. KE0001]